MSARWSPFGATRGEKVKLFQQFYSQIIFLCSSNIPENLVHFCCVGLFWKLMLDHLPCNSILGSWQWC